MTEQEKQWRIETTEEMDARMEELSTMNPPFSPEQFTRLAATINQLERRVGFPVNEEEVKMAYDAYREKLLSDPTCVNHFTSRLLEERNSVLNGELDWSGYYMTCLTVFNALKHLRTEESVRFLGSQLQDTKGSFPEDRYPRQVWESNHSNASFAVKALRGMDLDDPPVVDDDRLYMFPQLLIGRWQKWWAEVERGEREIRFRERTGLAGAVPGSSEKGTAERQVDRSPERRVAVKARNDQPGPGWLQWLVPALFLGLAAAYFLIRRFASHRA